MTEERSTIPGPDPTERTVVALRRDIGALEALVNVKFEKLDAAVGNLDRVLQERDRRYSERFEASDNAVKVALKEAREAAAKAVDQQEQAVAAAFEASEKAITKAEVSIEKRADATYVALTSLQQMLGNLMTRQESEQRFADALERIQSLSTRITQIEAVKLGAGEQRGAMSDSMRLAIAVGGFVILVLTFIAARGGL